MQISEEAHMLFKWHVDNSMAYILQNRIRKMIVYQYYDDTWNIQGGLKSNRIKVVKYNFNLYLNLK